MALFTQDPKDVLWDSTAVSNGFLIEYMPAAPEGYTKVYLYALLCQRAGLSVPLLADFAKALLMDEADVRAALAYWERCRLLVRTKDSPPEYLLQSVTSALTGKQSAPPDEGYMAFAQALYAIFGEKRRLHGGETSLAYEWVEQLGLPAEVVLMMVQHLSRTRGMQFSFKEAQKLAVELSDRGVRTIEDAETVFSRSEAARKGAAKVLRCFNLYREPTVAELDLFLKWTGEWGYTPSSIEAVCKNETTANAKNPSFKYIDGILEGMRRRGGKAPVTAEQVEKQLTDEEAAKAMLKAFGASSIEPDAGVISVYHEMLAVASPEVVLLAAGEMKHHGKKSLDLLLELLQSWQSKGLTDAAAVRAYLDGYREAGDLLREIYKHCGKPGAPTVKDREALAQWQTWASTDLLMLAADTASNIEKPIPYMDKILQGWKNAGAVTVALAQKEIEKFQLGAKEQAAAKGGKPGRTVVEQRYGQREYDPAKYDGLSAEELEEMKRYDA